MAGPAVSLNIGHGLQQQQRMSQALTPAMQQALKLLQLSSTQLDAAIRDALESNPLLALDEPVVDSQADDAATFPDRPDQAPNRRALQPVRRNPRAGYRPTPAAARLFGAAASAGPQGETRAGDAGAGSSLDAGGRTAANFRDVLFEDIVFAFENPAERGIAIDLCGMLDDHGYLAGDVADVAEFRLVSDDLVNSVLKRLQKVAPAGLFARDLAECLALQLEEIGALDPTMAALLQHLDLLTEKSPAALAAAAGIEADDLPAFLARLRDLDPKPGASLGGGAAPAIVPDLVVYDAGRRTIRNSDYEQQIGRWVVALNPDLVPRLSLDRANLEALRAQSRQETEKAYLKDRTQDATWLIRAIEQRTATILRVGVEIFRRQTDFLESGVSGLQPMTQKEIAAATDVHESTISRAANEKFAATPQGVIDLKFMFSAQIADLNGGPAHSAKVVRHRLRQLVDAESTPMSDDALAGHLRDEGFDVARRTVAKYREMLRIPSSVDRRRARGMRAKQQ